MRNEYLAALALLIFFTPVVSAEMIPETPDRQEAEGAWEWFQERYSFLADVIAAIALLLVLMLVAIFQKILQRAGIGAHSRTFSSPGLRFPPGHMAHRIYFLFIDLLRMLAMILVVFNFASVVNFDDFWNNQWWNLFVVNMLPAVFWATFFIVVAEFFKMLWIGDPDSWRDYMVAYGTTTSDIEEQMDNEFAEQFGELGEEF